MSAEDQKSDEEQPETDGDEFIFSNKKQLLEALEEVLPEALYAVCPLDPPKDRPDKFGRCMLVIHGRQSASIFLWPRGHWVDPDDLSAHIGKLEGPLCATNPS